MKKYLNLAFCLLALTGLCTGAIGLFAVGFLGSALTNDSWRTHGVVGANVVSCELGDISTSDECKTRGGLQTVYWANYKEIDWDAMATSAVNFDPVTENILSYAMVGGATFSKLTFERKQGFYDFTFTEDADVYDQLITMIFEGKSAVNSLAFKKAIGCCKIVLHIIDNNCIERVVGVEWNGTSFQPQARTLRIVRHLDSSGQLGSSKSRDEIDLGGESLSPPLYATVTEANVPV